MSSPLNVKPVLQRIDQGLKASCDALFALLRFSSVATDPAYHDVCVETAEWVRAYLSDIGFDTDLRPTTGQPVVVGRIGNSGPQILFYGHYDVQPADPFELWDTPPFEPRLGKGEQGQDCIFARGAQDDKGQFMTFVEAVKHWVSEHGELPFQLTVLIEGDEEGDTSHLDRFLAQNADEFSPEICIVCDTDMYDEKTPAITTSLRGCIAEEITITGPRIDLHSGYFGGPAVNPLKALSKLLDDLHDKNGRITISGFYDGVKSPSTSQRRQLQSLKFPERTFLKDVGLSTAAGESRYSLLEQVWLRPTAEVNGVWGGYQGAGTKTVLPAEAHAKLTFRLVEGQHPQKIHSAFRQYVRGKLPDGCKVSFKSQGGDSTGVHIAEDSVWVALGAKALEEEWGRAAALVGSGGSIPVVESFRKHLGVDSLMIGFGRKDDRVHSPNEKYDLESYHRGQRSFARLIAAIAEEHADD